MKSIVMNIQIIVTSLLVLLVTENAFGQSGSISTNEIAGGDRLNTITTAVPFLLIAPDSRHGAMGDAGVATDPDATAMHYNLAKLAFAKEKLQANQEITVKRKFVIAHVVVELIIDHIIINKRFCLYLFSQIFDISSFFF